MATLRLFLYDTAGPELSRLREGDVPRWARRLYSAYGFEVANAPLSRVVHALSEEMGQRLSNLAVLLGKVEQMGWQVRLQEDHLLVYSGLSAERSEELLDEAGVLTVARRLAPSSDRGGIGWNELGEPETGPVSRRRSGT
jgi:hypothetical protein